MKKLRLLGTLAATAFLANAVLAAGAAPADIAKAVADASRPKVDTDTDALRDPADTLAFAGVKPGMVVGELFPGGGYFTRMLSDLVGPKGKVYGIENTGWKGAVEADQEVVADLKRDNIIIDPESFGHFTLPQKIDLFWITQNYHDLHIAK
jgi:predicted methyltransferase